MRSNSYIVICLIILVTIFIIVLRKDINEVMDGDKHSARNTTEIQSLKIILKEVPNYKSKHLVERIDLKSNEQNIYCLFVSSKL